MIIFIISLLVTLVIGLSIYVWILDHKITYISAYYRTKLENRNIEYTKVEEHSIFEILGE